MSGSLMICGEGVCLHIDLGASRYAAHMRRVFMRRWHRKHRLPIHGDADVQTAERTADRVEDAAYRHYLAKKRQAVEECS